MAKRYLRYSLAALGIAIAVSGLALARWVNRVHFQEQLIADVERLGGIVTFSNDTPAGSSSETSWLQRWIGEKYFRQLRGIYLENQSLPHNFLNRVAQLPGIEELSVRENKLTDDALEPIGRMRKLRILHIGFNEVTDAGLVHLANLHELVLLDLCVTKVTNAGLRRLRTLPKLRRLELYAVDITNEGATLLAQMPQLSELDLANTKITSAGLEPLTKLPHLTDLRLDQMRLGEGQELRINDDALPHLLAMPKLHDLSIVSLPLSPAAIARLRQSKPTIIIRQ